MKDKLTKNKITRADRMIKNIRKFSLSLLVLSFISFVPLNMKLQANNEVIKGEILALKEQKEEQILMKEKQTNKVRKIVIIDKVTKVKSI